MLLQKAESGKIKDFENLEELGEYKEQSLGICVDYWSLE